MHNASRELVVFTRWHEEDLIGALAVREPVEELRAWSQLDTLPADRWLHLNFEALKTAPPTEVDPRQPGEALWERQHGAALLEACLLYTSRPDGHKDQPSSSRNQ